MVAAEFREVGHCGGRLTVITKTNEAGERSYAFRLSGSSPTPTAFFAIYALPPGVTAGNYSFIGGGQPPPFKGCYPVFIGSDSEGKFGHQCPGCRGYWRSEAAPSAWPITCPYCGRWGGTYMFRTDAQLAYVEAACEFIGEALASAKDGETSVDFDRVSDEAAAASGKKPGFFYAEKAQQNRFTCTACGVWNDVLGRYAYCSACGSRNDLQELEGSIASIREQINAGSGHENSVKELVGAFESAARQYAKQLLARIPVTARRRGLLEGKPFHNLRGRAADLREVFDIDILAGMSTDDVQFTAMMFHRRHVYEHNGGEADEQYLRDSGDISVQPKELIRETRENAHRLATLLTRMTRSLHEGFHGLLPPQSMPIQMQAERSARQNRNRRGP